MFSKWRQSAVLDLWGILGHRRWLLDHDAIVSNNIFFRLAQNVRGCGSSLKLGEQRGWLLWWALERNLIMGVCGHSLRGGPWAEQKGVYAKPLWNWWNFCIGTHFCTGMQLVVAAGLKRNETEAHIWYRYYFWCKRRWYLPPRRALRFSTSSFAWYVYSGAL